MDSGGLNVRHLSWAGCQREITTGADVWPHGDWIVLCISCEVEFWKRSTFVQNSDLK